MTKKAMKIKRAFYIVLMVICHLVLNALIVPLGAFISDVLYESTDWWHYCGTDSVIIGIGLLIPQAMWWLKKASRALFYKEDALLDRINKDYID